jgi:hypothetical protein
VPPLQLNLRARSKIFFPASFLFFCSCRGLDRGFKQGVFLRALYPSPLILYPFSMPGTERAEIYFIAAMMVLILILSFASVFFFFRQYKKEMRERRNREKQKRADKASAGS